MPPPESFCAFVLSHGRPDSVATIDALDRSGYTGDWRIVCDDEDATLPRYVARFGADRVMTFSKAAVAATFDTADLSADWRSVVFARNACFDLARQVGVDRFVQLDDDYSGLFHRFEHRGRLRSTPVRDADRLFETMVRWLDDTGAATVALAQGGDLLRGTRGNWRMGRFKRKAMNSFFCRAADTWRFVGRVNEDVCLYTAGAHRGLLCLTTLRTMVNQAQTQVSGGGMTELYASSGTYAKSFYPVMMCPSAVDVRPMVVAGKRLHHFAVANHFAPRIVPERFRKPSAGAA